MANKTILSVVTNKLKLSNGSFTDRIISQKTVYLLQEFGLTTTYIFKWYNYGVYSRELADDMFCLTIPQSDLTPIDPNTEKVTNFFIDFSGEDIKNPLFLERASSMRFILKQNPFIKKEELFKKIIEIKPHLDNNDQFNKVYDRIIKLS